MAVVKKGVAFPIRMDINVADAWQPVDLLRAGRFQRMIHSSFNEVVLVSSNQGSSGLKDEYELTPSF